MHRVRSNKRARNHKGRREWSIQLLSVVAKNRKQLWRGVTKERMEKKERISRKICVENMKKGFIRVLYESLLE